MLWYFWFVITKGVWRLNLRQVSFGTTGYPVKPVGLRDHTDVCVRLYVALQFCII